MYSGTVVYFCVGWVKSSMVLFFSGMSSTVISSTAYCFFCFFLTWYTAWQHENKNATKVSNSAARSWLDRERVPKLPERSNARSRYKANSRHVSIEAYPFALPCGERIQGERIDACSKIERAVV